MDIAALIAWLITALGGFVLLGRWIQRGGLRQQRAGGQGLPTPVVFSHFLLAATGLVLWIIYVAVDTTALAWIAFALLIVIALLGFTMLARWVHIVRSPATTGEDAAERSLPVPVIAAHGLVAVATLVLVLLSALGVGGS
ncbi:MAG: hypothetical protein ACTHOG_07730 [Marmoricola sp.]